MTSNANEETRYIDRSNADIDSDRDRPISLLYSQGFLMPRLTLCITRKRKSSRSLQAASKVNIFVSFLFDGVGKKLHHVLHLSANIISILSVDGKKGRKEKVFLQFSLGVVSNAFHVEQSQVNWFLFCSRCLAFC